MGKNFGKIDNFKAFDLPGLAQAGAELEKIIYSEGNYWRPKQKYKFGFYTQSKVDTQRTNLFEDGKLSALYLKHSIDYKFFQYRTEILSSILPYSKWDFSKIAITSTYKQTKAFSTENIVRVVGTLFQSFIEAVYFVHSCLSSLPWTPP